MADGYNSEVEVKESIVASVGGLSFDGSGGVPAKAETTALVTSQVKQDFTDEERLTPEERSMVENFVAQIDITNTQGVMQYGSQAQQSIARFSDQALSSVKTKDLGEIGKLLGDMVLELKDINSGDDKKGGLFGLFKKAENKVESIRTRYASAEVNVERIAKGLKGHQVTLMNDINMFDKMYIENLAYFKQLTMYIIAGKKRIDKARNEELPILLAEANRTGTPEDAQKANDFANMIDRFEKKLYDLETTRTVAMQMAPQIRLLQNNDQMMAEKIQSSLVNTIPLWKSQIVIALGTAHAAEAASAQKAVSDMTNELLRKNAESLRMSTIETAKESERAIIDIETLRHTNQQLISTFDDVLRIQAEGRQRRAEAEVELKQIENELKGKIQEMAMANAKQQQ